MTAPAIDLTLPSDRQLMGSAAPSPETEAARVTQGSPGAIHSIGEQLVAAGIDVDDLYGQSRRTQERLAGSFTNDGAPVYDEDLHRRRMPPGFRVVGSLMHDVGRRILVVSEELAAAIGAVNRSLEQLRADLNARRAAFAAEVDAAQGLDSLIPVEVAAGLQTRRNVVAGEMQAAVNACGREVGGRVNGYDQVLGRCLPILGELATVAPASGRGDASGTKLSFVLGGRFEASAPQPNGPQAEILPVPGPHQPDRGFTLAPTGFGPLITLPAPNLGADVQDGPGSGQRIDGLGAPGVHIDPNDGGPPADGLTPEEQGVAEKARGIYRSPELGVLRQAALEGRPAEVKVGDTTVVYEPGLPASGITLFEEGGFVLGAEALVSEEELSKTIAHEVYRLETSNSQNGLDKALVNTETGSAASFAERSNSYVLRS